MVLRLKSVSRRITAGVCVLLLTLFLAACGGGQTGNSHTGGVTPTASKASGMKLYRGDGFTIEYPQTWKALVADPEVAFTDPTGNYNLTVGVATNVNKNLSAEQLVVNGANGAKSNLKNVQAVTVPQTETLDGQIWNQRALAGTNNYRGQVTTVEADILATNYPVHTAKAKGYIIAYVALKDQFARASALYFTPMLASFQFTS